MSDFIEIMVDLETMSTESNAAIVSIGAVVMDFEKGTVGEEFYTAVDLQSSLGSGGHISASTVNWWLEQSSSAREALLKDPTSINQALVGFATWLYEHGPTKKIRIWGKGAAFDNVVLRNAYKRMDYAAPWSFRNDMCYRTLEALNKDIPLPEREGTAHNALDDAIFQAVHLIEIMRNKRRNT